MTIDNGVDRRFVLKAAAASAASVFLASCGVGTNQADRDVAQQNQSGETANATNANSSDVNAKGETNETVSTDSETYDSAGLEPFSPASFDKLAVCALLPSATAGPFPTKQQLNRRDLTEGYPGEPLRLGIRVVDKSCKPIPGAELEIWHCDATGDYSSYIDDGTGKDEGEGTTFLRGFQKANENGILEFQTIFPGWYEGRAIHIHARARVDGKEVLTTQFYFDDDTVNRVCNSGVYAQFGLPDTPTSRDGIAGNPASDGSQIQVETGKTWLGNGLVGRLNVGVSA